MFGWIKKDRTPRQRNGLGIYIGLHGIRFWVIRKPE